jgi:hypothetical protein
MRRWPGRYRVISGTLVGSTWSVQFDPGAVRFPVARAGKPCLDLALMTYPGRPEPPLAGDETATLLGSLDRERAIFAWKCGELDAAGLSATLTPSSMTLGGLLKHLAFVEDEYFSRRLLGRDLGPPWDTVDWDVDPDWEWNSAAEDSPEQLYALWQDAVACSRSAVAEALADGGLDRLVTGITNSRGESPSLRRILIDLIEEYARHVGHADLIRESVDGLTGEDPPG